MKILVVDDNRSSAEAMGRILRKHGHEVTTLHDGEAAIRQLECDPPDLVFTDLRMEPVDGMEVLRAARERPSPVDVVVFTAFGAVDKAVEAMRLGARDFLTKPISVEQILERVHALEQPSEPPLLPTPSHLLRTLEAIADVRSPVWIEGEVGSGRTAAARQLHALGRPEEPFEVLDPTRMDDWPEGVAVLPDVDELDAAQQQALARRLKHLPRNTRLISTARPGAQEAVREGRLRSDLYFTLAVVVVPIPPLRERKEEIVPLFEEALATNCTRYGRPLPPITEAMRTALVNHDWPGNLKELHNLAERTAVLGPNGFGLRPAPAPREPTDLLTDGFRLSDYLEQVERDLLRLALEKADGDRTLAGKYLGVERNTLRYKLKKYGLWT